MSVLSDRIDPDLRLAFSALDAVDPEQDIAETRRAHALTVRRAAGHPDPRTQVFDREVEVSGGHSVRVRVYRPAGSASSGILPALLWMHGGGFRMGLPETDEAFCCRVSVDANCVVASVDYRLAPEHPFPAAMDDCYRVLNWLAARPAGLGVDARRLAVGGASAGGGLGAGLALLARDRKGPAIGFQFLKYPCLDDRLETRSSHEIDDPRLWDREQARRAWRDYLGGLANAVPAYAAPARAADLRGVPPTYIYAAELDLLRDEDIEYARRLLDAGVSVELHVAPGTFHGSEGLVPEAAVSQRNVDEFVAVIARALHPNPN
ncbi:MAG: alpha/beta hydrolase [Candidatus Dormibacteraeota bacterium]|nr:alpha/beta hydrolase [Candidatus Dormibacteraeota bacterium]